MTTQELLAAVASGKITPEEAAKLLPHGKGRQKITMKISEKGALSVYGLGRFPTTLYVEQWERLLDDDQVKAMRDFIKANAAKLPRKRTQTALTTTRPAQHRARNQPAKPMTLAEARKLLKQLPGRNVRDRPVDCVWLTLSREGDAGLPYQLCAILEPHPPRNGATTMERVLAMVTRMQCVECACRDEEELRRVIQDPSLGEWCFDDECPSCYR